MNVLGQIRESRKSKKLTQGDMAKRLNISQPGYQKIEKGENVLSVERFLEICRILEIDSYNDLLPAISADIVEKVERVLNENSFAFKDIYTFSKNSQKLVDELVSKVKDEKIEKDEIIKELKILDNYLALIRGGSQKESYEIVSIRDLKERID